MLSWWQIFVGTLSVSLSTFGFFSWHQEFIFPQISLSSECTLISICQRTHLIWQDWQYFYSTFCKVSYQFIVEILEICELGWNKWRRWFLNVLFCMLCGKYQMLPSVLCLLQVNGCKCFWRIHMPSIDLQHICLKWKSTLRNNEKPIHTLLLWLFWLIVYFCFDQGDWSNLILSCGYKIVKQFHKKKGSLMKHNKNSYFTDSTRILMCKHIILV